MKNSFISKFFASICFLMCFNVTAHAFPGVSGGRSSSPRCLLKINEESFQHLVTGTVDGFTVSLQSRYAKIDSVNDKNIENYIDGFNKVYHDSLSKLRDLINSNQCIEGFNLKTIESAEGEINELFNDIKKQVSSNELVSSLIYDLATEKFSENKYDQAVSYFNWILAKKD